MLRQAHTTTTLALLSGLLMLLQGCGTTPISPPTRDSGPRQAKDFSHLPDAVPRHEPQTRAGNPPTYVVHGRRYNLLDSNRGYVERGYASWYGKKFHGRTTSNGEIYDMYAMTAAHKTLRIPTYVQVTNLRNGRQIVVRVNDRGPFHDNRIIDLSYAAASRLGFVNDGVAMVEVRVVEPGTPLPPAQIAQPAPPVQPVQPAPVSRPVAEAPPAPPAAPARTHEAEPLASEPAIASTPTLSEPVGGPLLYLQMGSFISRDNAESLRARLAMGNVDRVQVQHYTVDRQPIFRVRIGPLPSAEEADRVALQISRLGIGEPTIVVD